MVLLAEALPLSDRLSFDEARAYLSLAALALRAAVSRQLAMSTGAGADDFHLAASIASEQESHSPFAMLPRADVRDLTAVSNWLSPDVADAIVRAARVDAGDPFQKLTPCERAVPGVRLTDATLEEIATEHYLSVTTVKSQMRSAYRKLGISPVEELRSLAALTASRRERAHRPQVRRGG